MLDMEDVRAAIAQAMKARGAEVTGEGYGYDNGPYEALSIRLSNGLEIYIQIEDYEEA